MKKVLAAALAVIMAGAFSGCSPNNSEESVRSFVQSQKQTQISQTKPQISEVEPVESSVSSNSDSSGNEVSGDSSVSEAGDNYNVAVHIDFEHNAVFSTYDVDVSVDGTKQQTIKHGTDSDFTLSLAEGEHRIVFANSEDAGVDGSVSLNVAGDMNVSYKISCHYYGVDIEDENGGKVNESSVVSSTNSEDNASSVSESEIVSIPTEPSEPVVSEPEIVSTPNETESTITVDNCAELQNLIYLDSQTDQAAIKSFAEKYKGKTLELEMLTAFVQNHGNYKTRFDYLLYAVQNGSAMLAGPAFMFEDVNYFDLNLTGSNIPDSFGTGIHCRVKAKIEGYDSASQWILLDPVSIEVITAY